jgi:hypothetical protein
MLPFERKASRFCGRKRLKVEAGGPTVEIKVAGRKGRSSVHSICRSTRAMGLPPATAAGLRPECANSGHCVSMDGPRKDACLMGSKTESNVRFSGQRRGKSPPEGGRRADRDRRRRQGRGRRAMWLTAKGARSLEAGLADWKRAHSGLREAPQSRGRPAIGSGRGGARGGLGARRSESGFSHFRLAHALAGPVFLAWR